MLSTALLLAATLGPVPPALRRASPEAAPPRHSVWKLAGDPSPSGTSPPRRPGGRRVDPARLRPRRREPRRPGLAPRPPGAGGRRPDLSSVDRECGLAGAERAAVVAAAFAAPAPPARRSSARPARPRRERRGAGSASRALRFRRPLAGALTAASAAVSCVPVAGRGDPAAQRVRSTPWTRADGASSRLSPPSRGARQGDHRSAGWCNAFGAARPGSPRSSRRSPGSRWPGRATATRKELRATGCAACSAACRPVPLELLRAFAGNWLLGEITGSRNPDVYPAGRGSESLRAAGLVRVF